MKHPPDTSKRFKILKSEEIKGCNICGGKLAMIRGRFPGQDKREVCPTCLQERLEQINGISGCGYGTCSQEIK